MAFGPAGDGHAQELRGAPPALRLPDVRYEPSEMEVVRAMLRLAHVTPEDVVYDLGCGDGRIVVAAARLANARGACVDIDPRLNLTVRPKLLRELRR